MPATASTQSSQPRRPGHEIAGRCHLCAATGLTVVPFRYVFRDRHLWGVRCRSCGLVFIDPQPSAEEIANLYSEEYFTECSDTCGAHGPSAYMEMAVRRGAERTAGAARLDALFRRHAPDHRALMEIGCGPGFLLDEMRKLGWHVSGLEISAYAAKYAQEELGIDVILGTIESAAISPASVDVVYMGDVLEHLPDPLCSLRTVREWLAPGGILVIAVPATLNLVSARIGMLFYRLRGGFKTLRIPPYHLFEYTPRSLKEMITAAGFTVLDLRQSAVSLRKMGLRGSLLENAGKASLQLLAHLTARLFNCGGDRLLAVAKRTES